MPAVSSALSPSIFLIPSALCLLISVLCSAAAPADLRIIATNGTTVGGIAQRLSVEGTRQNQGGRMILTAGFCHFRVEDGQKRLLTPALSSFEEERERSAKRRKYTAEVEG
jgi:hypothetical protein